MSVCFGNRPGALDSARDILGQPQSRPRNISASYPVDGSKSGKGKKFVLGSLATAVVVAAGLALGSKFKGFDKLINKLGGASATGLKGMVVKGAGMLNTAGEFICNYAKMGLDFVKGFFKKTP